MNIQLLQKSSVLDLHIIRADTPRTGEVVHLNSAGSSLMPTPVYQAMLDYQEEEWQNGGYETMSARAQELQGFYVQAAQLLNSDSEEIAFTDSATTSWQRAFFSLDWKNDDEIITSNTEYASNYISFLRLRKLFQITIRVAEDNEYGEVDVDHLESLINEKTRLLAITHMPTMGGVVNPAEEIGRIAKKHNILYILDACQSIGQYPLDVKKIGCHMLSGTGRKYLRGPRGTGLLYVQKDLIQEMDPFSIDLFSGQWMDMDSYRMRKNAVRFENFEKNYAAKVGLARAIQYQNDLGIRETWERIQYLGEIFRKGLSEIDGITVHDTGRVMSGIVTFSIAGKSAAETSKLLSESGVNVSFAFTANSRLYMEKKGLEEVVRASVHYFNTEDELALAFNVLSEITN